MKDWSDNASRAFVQGFQRALELGVAPGRVSAEGMRRIRILSGVSLGLCTFAAGPWVFQWASVGLGHLSLALVVTVVAALANLLVLRQTRKHYRAGHIGLAILSLFLTYSTFATGGFHSPNSPWFLMIPLCGAVVIGLRGALGWTAYALGVTGLMFGLDQAGIVFENPIPVEARTSLMMVDRAVLMVAVTVIAASFVNSHRRVELELLEASSEARRETIYRELVMHAAIASSEASTLADATRDGVDRICEAMGWVAATVYNVDERGRAYVGGVIRAFDPRLAPLKDLVGDRVFAPGEGAVGRAAVSGIPICEPIAFEQFSGEIAATAQAAGVHTAFAVPVPVRGTVCAVLEFALPSLPDDRERMVEVFTVIGAEFGKVEERTWMQDHLRQRQKMEAVGQLAAGVAHEINNPMSYVRTNLHQLREVWEQLRSKQDPATPAHAIDDFDALIGESLEGVERTIHIVRSIREFSYMGKSSERETRRVDLVDLAHVACRVAASQAPAGVSVDVLAEAGDAVADCVPNEIQQVLVNLVVNAIQAVAGEGQVQVFTGSDAEAVYVRVEDDGPGIAEGSLTRLFDPFYTTKPVGEGTGLGLAVSYEILRGHGGELVVDSTPGEGATFTMRLPRPAGPGVDPA